MFIKELETKTGLTRHTIRFYEKQGFLPERYIRRGENTYRSYTEDAVEYLLMLKAGQGAGFTLAELREFIEADDAGSLTTEQKIVALRQKMAEIDRKKAELDRIQTYLARLLTKKLALKDAEENALQSYEARVC